MGQAPPGEAYNESGEGWPLIAGAGDFANGKPHPKKYTREASKKSRAGDIILGVRASIGEKVLSDGEYCLGRGVASLRASNELDNRYLWHWLTAATPTLAAKGRGATFKQVNRVDIGKLLIPLPKLREQRRIAEVLDQADELRTKRRQAIDYIDKLIESIFHDMFGQPESNAEGWPIARIADIAEVQGGLQLSRARSRLPVEVPYLRVANVHRRRLDLSDVKTIRASHPEITRTLLQTGDLLIVEGHGNAEEIGRSALWDGSIKNCVHQNHLIRVRFDRSQIAPTYAEHYLNSPEGRKHLLRAAKTTSGLKTISVSDVRSAPLPVPPLELQHEFARRLRTVELLTAKHRATLSLLDDLFATLQHRAFRGLL